MRYSKKLIPKLGSMHYEHFVQEWVRDLEWRKVKPPGILYDKRSMFSLKAFQAVDYILVLASSRSRYEYYFLEGEKVPIMIRAEQGHGPGGAGDWEFRTMWMVCPSLHHTVYHTTDLSLLPNILECGLVAGQDSPGGGKNEIHLSIMDPVQTRLPADN